MPTNPLYNFVKKNNITKPIFLSYSAAVATIIYLFLFTIFGEKGIVNLITRKHQMADKQNIRQELYAKMKSKQNSVGRMSNESLDIDLLDEQARKILGYAGKNEIIIYQDQPKETQ